MSMKILWEEDRLTKTLVLYISITCEHCGHEMRMSQRMDQPLLFTQPRCSRCLWVQDTTPITKAIRAHWAEQERREDAT